MPTSVTPHPPPKTKKRNDLDPGHDLVAAILEVDRKVHVLKQDHVQALGHVEENRSPSHLDDAAPLYGQNVAQDHDLDLRFENDVLAHDLDQDPDLGQETEKQISITLQGC